MNLFYKCDCHKRVSELEERMDKFKYEIDAALLNNIMWRLAQYDGVWPSPFIDQVVEQINRKQLRGSK